MVPMRRVLRVLIIRFGLGRMLARMYFHLVDPNDDFNLCVCGSDVLPLPLQLDRYDICYGRIVWLQSSPGAFPLRAVGGHWMSLLAFVVSQLG
jgi:hypothetical protein